MGVWSFAWFLINARPGSGAFATICTYVALGRTIAVEVVFALSVPSQPSMVSLPLSKEITAN